MPAIPIPTPGRVVHFFAKSYGQNPDGSTKEIVTLHVGQVMEYHPPAPPKGDEAAKPNRGEITLWYAVVNQPLRFATGANWHPDGLPGTWRYPPRDNGEIEVTP